MAEQDLAAANSGADLLPGQVNAALAVRILTPHGEETRATENRPCPDIFAFLKPGRQSGGAHDVTNASYALIAQNFELNKFAQAKGQT